MGMAFTPDPKSTAFWTKVYTEWDFEDGVVHDAKDLSIIYQKLDFRKSSKNGSPRGTRIRAAKDYWRKILLALHQKTQKPNFNPSSLKGDEKLAYGLWTSAASSSLDPLRFYLAAHRKRLRFQSGQRSAFKEGLIRSGRFLPEMEKVFEREKIPVEFTRLPFVESSFNTQARSRVGASGIWQFMESTGKLFLMVNDAVDERNDPIRATEAAAAHLKLNFESLKSWPLAITAYNHGRKSLLRGMAELGSSDLGDFIQFYKGRSFGFSSANFYTQLFTVIEIERNWRKYFGDLVRDSATECKEVKITSAMTVAEICKSFGVTEKSLKELNPAIEAKAWQGLISIPQNYRLRLPK